MSQYFPLNELQFMYQIKKFIQVLKKSHLFLFSLKWYSCIYIIWFNAVRKAVGQEESSHFVLNKKVFFRSLCNV